MPEALLGAEIVWIAYDTPVDEEDRADVESVVDRIIRLFPYLESDTLVLISSQLPVGTTRRIEDIYESTGLNKAVTFAYSPENLRLGKAIQTFTQPDRVVAGVRSGADRRKVTELFRPFTDRIVWMSVESAEMTKHTLNAFLATSITFINELATLCEQVGADAKEVERGLKTDARIGPRAYLSPGTAFAGGTLARDLMFLTGIGAAHNRPTHLLSAVKKSNDAHRQWTRHKLQSILGNLCGQKVALWGLTYKPGTDTLRRSASVELCEWLLGQGVSVRAHDPAVKILPGGLAQKVELEATPLAATTDAVALVVATEWPEYQFISSQKVMSSMKASLVIDPNRFLVKTLGNDPRIRYITIGKPEKPHGQ
jgi:UDPglucose 6-dehydrogenase